MGRVTNAGEFNFLDTDHQLGHIATGSDGNLWFTDVGNNAATTGTIGYMTP